MHQGRRKLRLATVAVVAAVALVAAACSSSSSSTGGKAAVSLPVVNVRGAADEKFLFDVTEFRKIVELLYTAGREERERISGYGDRRCLRRRNDGGGLCE